MPLLNRVDNSRNFLCSLLIFSCLTVFGQPQTPINALVQSFDQYRKSALQEKLFLHTDQAFYLTGETMWFKAYYVDGTLHQPLDVSKVGYVELLDKEQRPVLQTKIELGLGGGSGSLFLPASLNAGTYLMRGYTNWMKNVGADFFFEKTLTIVNPFKPLNLPLLKTTPNYDVAFFPEGGQLVQGLLGRVAFNVADASGRGVAVRGWLLNAQNDTLTRFGSHKFGIGTFDMTPAEGATYRVVLRDTTGQTVTRLLPAIQTRGYTMRVADAPDNKLSITVATNANAATTVYLFAHTRNDIKVAEMQPVSLNQAAGSATFLLDKTKLGEGISHLTIFDSERKPVCERLYFKRPTQTLSIAIKPDQPQYAPRQTVKLAVSVTTAGQSAKTNSVPLSMAVYRVDSLGDRESGNILSYLWLTSDLRGRIESPDYYLQAENDEVTQATDNLMMTHGWRRFRWNEVMNPGGGEAKPTQSFIPEHNGLIVEGMVADPATGTPVKNVVTYLSAPGKPIRLYTSLSNAAGQVRFELSDFYGPRNLVLQTNPEDSLYKLTITNPFSEVPSKTIIPQFSLAESQANQLLDRSVAMQVQSIYGADRVRYRYPDVDSSAFYGKPTETYLLDAYTRFPRMEEVLREYVPGVLPRKRQGRFRLFVPNTPYSTLFDTPSLVLVDGVPVFDMDRVIDFSPLKIKQLDVITNQYFVGQTAFSGIISFMTYKGDLAGYALDSRLLNLDYQGLQLQREFYTPRHTGSPTRLPDARTLLYWNPDLKTDAQAKVLVEFPTSDQTGTFVVEINGLAPDGSAGFGRTLFEVK